MINKFLLLILQGLLAILPFFLTIYLLVWMASSVEDLLAPYLIKTYYFPGLGIVTVLLTLALVGLLVSAYGVRSILGIAHALVDRVPVVKTIFGAIQDAVELFQINKEQGNKKAVSVEVADGLKLVGFVTNEKVSNVLFPNENKIAVYLPLSYQIGGYTLYVEPEKVSDLNIDVETAMRIAVTGGSSISNKHSAKK